MKLLLKLFQFYIPAKLRKYVISQLFTITAEAFACQVPSLKGLTVDECLEKYANFTAYQAEQAIEQQRDLQVISEQLYQNAYQLGNKVRNIFNIRTKEEILLISKLIYQLIGIDFKGNQSGEIIIKSCYFSSVYSFKVCRLISALDRGVAAGLTDGGQLNFSERITEGKNYCRGHLQFKGE